MENKDKPAYPSKNQNGCITWTNSAGKTVQEPVFYPGLTKREVFAMAAMQGLLAKEAWTERIIGEGGERTMCDQFVYASIKLADELLRQLKSKS